MRILVTGGAGFIGKNLVERLALDTTNKIIVMDNFVCLDDLYVRPVIKFPDSVKVVHGDIREHSDFAKLGFSKLDMIYHLAASFANELSVDFPFIDMQTNINGTLNVIQYGISCGVKTFVYTGSSSSYGHCNTPAQEEQELYPSTPYALSKLVGEKYVKLLSSTYDFRIFRLFNVYGKYDYPGKYRNVIPRMVYDGITAGKIYVFGGNSTRDFTHVDDVVDTLTRKPVSEKEIVNLGTGVEVGILKLAETIQARLKELSISVEIIKCDKRDWDSVTRRAADITKLRRLYPGITMSDFSSKIHGVVDWLVNLLGKRA